MKRFFFQIISSADITLWGFLSLWRHFSKRVLRFVTQSRDIIYGGAQTQSICFTSRTHWTLHLHTTQHAVFKLDTVKVVISSTEGLWIREGVAPLRGMCYTPSPPDKGIWKDVASFSSAVRGGGPTTKYFHCFKHTFQKCNIFVNCKLRTVVRWV